MVKTDVVELTLPPDAAYLTVLRTAAAGLAARLDFTLDEIEDLRIAVDEACALLLADVRVPAVLTCRFELDGEGMDITVSAPTRTGRPPARDSFAWTVLAALAGDVDATTDDDDRVSITLHKRRGERSTG